MRYRQDRDEQATFRGQSRPGPIGLEAPSSATAYDRFSAFSYRSDASRKQSLAPPLWWTIPENLAIP